MLNFEPVVAPIIKPVVAPTNKDKLYELARTLLNEHCSAVLLKKLPEKLGDPGKFLIPCNFLRMDECLALADLGASINLMPLSVWNKLSLPELSPTCMTLELADHSISRRSFLKTGRALINVFEGELTLRVGKEAITLNLDQTLRYSANYNDMMTNRIDVIDMAYEEKLLVSQIDFLLEEVDAFLALEDDATSPKVDQSYFEPEGDILLLEAFLNDDPSLPPPNQGNYRPQVRKELKICEAKTDKSSIDEPPEVELKVSNIHSWKDINPEFYTKKILMEDDFELAVQHQRRVNPKIYDVIKKEVLKLLDAGLIYPISDSPWVSPVHCVPKKGGFTVVENEENELIPTRLVTGWPGNECYCFLDGFLGYFQSPIDPKDQEKITFTCSYGTFAYRRMPFSLCNAPGTFQKCMMAIFHDMIEKIMEVFMDDFSVFGNSFQTCLSYLEKMLKRCEDTNLCVNWEKSHFMVKEGIVLIHKISKNGIEVDKAKVDVIAKLPHPTTVKAYKTPIGCTSYKLVYEKACHLLVELKHKAYWALKHANFDLHTAGDHIKVQLNELNKLRDQAYENSLIYKEKTKRIHDSKIKSRLNIFSGKLKTRWSGPFTITHMFPYGTIELSQTNGPNFKVNIHRLKHYFGEDIPKMVVPDLQTFPKD
nr:DNA-directed DNA polymerase [Tanacetum cinerariifolium]